MTLYVQTDDVEWDGANHVRAYHDATDSEILAAVLNLEGVETVEWCAEHGASKVAELGGCGYDDPKDCSIVFRAIIPIPVEETE